MRFCWIVLVAAPLAGAPTSVSAQTSGETSIDRLEAWLGLHRGAMEETRLVSGPVSIAAGALVFGVGVTALADGQYAELAEPSLGWLQLGVGAMGVAQGVVWLLITSTPEARWERWRAARARGLDEPERLRFEGELRSYRQIAQMERALYRWSGLGLIFGGVVALGATPGAGLEDAHMVASYLSAGLYTGAGLFLLVASLIPTPGEDAWEHYERGESPVTWRWTPSGITGRF